MSKKDEIVLLLKARGPMSQSEIAEVIYGDRHYSSRIYSALNSLVKRGEIIKSRTYPKQYSFNEEFIYNDKKLKANTISSTIDTKKLKSEKKKPGMAINDAVTFINSYFNRTKEDSNGRFKSWEHCYRVFGENRNKEDDQTVDYLALNLAFYLASWGMYRASSFLLQKDYKIHIPVVRIIQKKRYDPLYGISAKKIREEENLNLLDELSKNIKNCYGIKQTVKNDESYNATDTLVTKILLGTLGCVPAYDRYYVQSVKKYNISSGAYNRKSVSKVAEFYCAHSKQFEVLRNVIRKNGIDYPPMKLMDMCFWQANVENEQSNLN